MTQPPEIFDSLDLDRDGAVVFTPQGLPARFRLLKAGENRLVKAGRPQTLDLTPAMVDEIVAAHEAKGEAIPVDSRHALYHAAEAAGVDEAEALRAVPGGVAALGFARLRKGADGGLWCVMLSWSPIARQLLLQKSIRYFSPVIRGLDGASPLRVTSVALDNVPALTSLPSLAAGAEPQTPATPQGNIPMEKTRKPSEAS